MCQLTNMGAYEVFSKNNNNNNNNNNNLLLLKHKIAFKYDLMHNLGLVVTVTEYPSVTSYKMKFVKLWDLLRYSERITSKTPTRQKLAIWGRLSLRY